MKFDTAITSPYNIELLLHVHCTPAPIRDSGCKAEALGKFQFLGAIVPDEESGSGWRTTPLGAAWVKALCRVPCPRTAYIDTDGTVLDPQS